MLVGYQLLNKYMLPPINSELSLNTEENLVTSASVAVASDSEKNVENFIEPVAPMEHAE